MAKLEKKNLDSPDEVRDAGKGKINVVSLSSGNVGRLFYEPGWKWSTDVKPIHKTESCELHHVGVVESGSIRVKMNDGTEEEFGPGDAFEVPPGHDAWVTGKEPFVGLDFGAFTKR